MPDIEGDRIKIVITGEDKASSVLDKQIKNLQNLSSQIEKINREFSRARSVKGLEIFSKALQELSEASAGVTKFANALGRVKPENFSNFAQGIRLITHELQALQNVDADKLKDLADIARGLRSAKGTATQKAVQPSQAKSLAPVQGTGATAQQMSQTGSAAANASSGVDAFNNALKVLDFLAIRVPGGILKTTRGIISFTSRIAKAVSPTYALMRAIGSVSSRVGRLYSDFMRIAKYRLLRSLIKMVTQGFSEGIKNAYQYAVQTGNEFQATMDRMATTALYVKNSLGAMAMPLLNVLAPALDYVADKFVALLNTINQFIASITNQPTWTKALRYTKSFGDGTKDAANGAKKAVDDLKATILGIDEINLLNDNNERAGSGASGGAAADDYSSMFETVETKASKFSQTLSDLFQPFKDAWENQGSGVMEAWKSSTNSVKNLLVDVGNTFKTVWTGGTGQQIIENILTTWKNILTTVGNVADGIKAAWDANGNGERIAKNILGIFESLSGYASDISGWIANWAADVDWEPFMNAVAELSDSLKTFIDDLGPLIDTLFHDVVEPVMTWAVENVLPSLTEFLTGLTGFASYLAESITLLLNGDFSGFKERSKEYFGNLVEYDEPRKPFNYDDEYTKQLMEDFGIDRYLRENNQRPFNLTKKEKNEIETKEFREKQESAKFWGIPIGKLYELGGNISEGISGWLDKTINSVKEKLAPGEGLKETAGLMKQGHDQVGEWLFEKMFGKTIDESVNDVNNFFDEQKGIFKEGWEYWFGTSNPETEKYVKDQLGKKFGHPFNTEYSGKKLYDFEPGSMPDALGLGNLLGTKNGSISSLKEKMNQFFQTKGGKAFLKAFGGNSQTTIGIKSKLDDATKSVLETLGVDPTVTKELDLKAGGGYAQPQVKQWISIKDTDATKNLKSKVDPQFNTNKNTWDNTYKNGDSTKSLKSKLVEFFKPQKDWDGTYKDGDATKNLKSQLDKLFKNNVTPWDNTYKPGSVVKTLTSELSKSWTPNKESYASVKDKTVTSTMDATQTADFKQLTKEYVDLKSGTKKITFDTEFKVKLKLDSGKDKTTITESVLNGKITYANGGFPASGQLFVANENGPEYVGSFGSRTAVANSDQIVEGITQGVANAQTEQNKLLREQNELLRAIYSKEGNGGSATSSDVLRALTQTSRRTGHPVVSMG